MELYFWCWKIGLLKLSQITLQKEGEIREEFENDRIIPNDKEEEEE